MNGGMICFTTIIISLRSFSPFEKKKRNPEYTCDHDVIMTRYKSQIEHDFVKFDAGISAGIHDLILDGIGRDLELLQLQNKLQDVQL